MWIYFLVKQTVILNQLRWINNFWEGAIQKGSKLLSIEPIKLTPWNKCKSGYLKLVVVWLSHGFVIFILRRKYGKILLLQFGKFMKPCWSKCFLTLLSYAFYWFEIYWSGKGVLSVYDKCLLLEVNEKNRLKTAVALCKNFHCVHFFREKSSLVSGKCKKSQMSFWSRWWGFLRP